MLQKILPKFADFLMIWKFFTKKNKTESLLYYSKSIVKVFKHFFLIEITSSPLYINE